MWHTGDGMGWWMLWGGLMMILFWGAIIALVVWAVQSGGRRDDGPAPAGAAPAATAPGTGTSTVAMVACCAHHVTDVLPVLGLSGAAIFLNDYRIPLMTAGLAVNALGVAGMLRLAAGQTPRLRMEASAC